MNTTMEDITTGNLDGTTTGILTSLSHITSTEIIIVGMGVLFIIAHLIDRKYSYPKLK
jgi:hypothetical protein